MVAVRHVGLSKFDIFITKPFCARAVVSSSFQNSSQLDNTEPNYDQYGVCPPSWIWEFLKFSHAEIWIYNDYRNCGRPPCWIYCDVIILYMKTEFNALDHKTRHNTCSKYMYVSLERTARWPRSVTKKKTKKNIQTPCCRSYSRRALYDLPQTCLVIELIDAIKKASIFRSNA